MHRKFQGLSGGSDGRRSGKPGHGKKRRNTAAATGGGDRRPTRFRLERLEERLALSATPLISEIMYHPASNDPLDEYIELDNPANVAVDLTDWEISGGVKYTLPSVSIPANGRLVVAADVAAFSTAHPGVTNVVGGWSSKLSDSGELLNLKDSSGSVVNSVTYADQGEWAEREQGPLDHGHRGWQWSDQADGLGSSLELVSTGLTNEYGQNWRASTTIGGTPGAANSVADADNDVAPLIENLTQFPIVPSSTDPVVISARLIDETAAGDSARLYWRVDGTHTFNIVTMTDDGAGSDATAGDQVFTATIPPQADGTVVEFYLQSEDEHGNLRTFPAPTDLGQSANLLYQVDNSFDPNAATAPGGMPNYRFIMTEAARAELQQIGSNNNEGYSHAQMNGTFISATDQGLEVRYNVGIRNRGVSSRARLPNSYHLNIPSDAPWHGVDEFNLNTQYTPYQLAGLKLFQAADGISEDSQAVKLLVNGADLSTSGSPAYGVYVQFEAADSDFAKNHFPADDNGNLYRIIRNASGTPGGDLSDLGSNPNSYSQFYDKKTNVGANDYSDVMQLVDILNNTPDATYFQQVQQVVDVSQWVNYFAINAILANTETALATGDGDDYLLYSGVNDPRFQLISHDFDSILGRHGSQYATSGIYEALDNPTIERFLTNPEIAPLYHNRLVELLNTTFSKDQFDSYLDNLLTGFTPTSVLNDMKSFMDVRRPFILAQLQSSLTASSPLTVVNGLPKTTQDIATLYGTAPLAGVGSILVNGQLANLDPFTGEWSIGEATGGQSMTLIAKGANWSYLDAGQVPSTSPGSDWRIDDPGWTDSGNAQLGYGDGDEATTVSYIDTDPGQSGTQKNITTYFRKTFDVTDAASMQSLSMQLLVDDGAVVYLNGNEVQRRNMPGGAINSTTRANVTVAGGDEDRFFDYTLDPADLVEGQNVLAVEVHQIHDNSSDISFDMELVGSTGNSNTISGFDLNPGINRVAVEQFDGPNGTGKLVDSTAVDVWYDDGNVQTIPGGTINTNTTWSAANGPYVVTGDITVSGGGTLTIEPGTSVFFNSGVGLTVSGTGQIIAEGTQYQRIRLAANPLNGTSGWDGLNFQNTATDNRLTYIDMSSGDGQGRSVEVVHGRVLFDHASWFDVNRQVLTMEHPTMTVSNSSIPAISGDETIHLFGMDPNEQLIFDNNIIGKNTSHNDVVDMGHNSQNPGTVVFRNNQFLGGWDDGIDTDGFIVLIENNTFTDFHLNSSRPTTSNAVTTGRGEGSGPIVSSQLTLIGNTFYDNDHDVLLKDGGYANLIHNTMVGATISSIQFNEIHGTNVLEPGYGADLDGNIIWGAAQAFTNIVPESHLTVNHSIVPAEDVGYGTGNLTSDPLLVDPANGDFSLLPGSPAIGAGPDGSEIGAYQLPDLPLADASNLRITELNYHPTAGNFSQGEVAADGDLFEFIELQNISGSDIDLSGAAFTDGIDFTFPAGSFLAGGERLVLVANADIFASRYGAGIVPAGEFENDSNLSNGGETIRLADASGGTIVEFTYDDNHGWPTAPDGDGPTLVVLDTEGNYNSPTNWAASANNGGSPGTAGSVSLPADFDGDNDVDGADLTAWEGGYGTQTGAAHSDGDANGDQAVDGFDFLSWQRSYTGSPPALAAASVDASAVAQLSAPKSQTNPRPDASHDALFGGNVNWRNDNALQGVAQAVRQQAAGNVAASTTAPLARPNLSLGSHQHAHINRGQHAERMKAHSIDLAFTAAERSRSRSTHKSRAEHVQDGALGNLFANMFQHNEKRTN